MLCNSLEGWDGWEVEGKFRREGTYVYLWLIHVDVWQKPAQYCKANILLYIYFLRQKKDVTKNLVCFYLYSLLTLAYSSGG